MCFQYLLGNAKFNSSSAQDPVEQRQEQPEESVGDQPGAVHPPAGPPLPGARQPGAPGPRCLHTRGKGKASNTK